MVWLHLIRQWKHPTHSHIRLRVSVMPRRMSCRPINRIGLRAAGSVGFNYA